MAMGKKAALALAAGVGALLIGGVAMAATGKKKSPAEEAATEDEATAVAPTGEAATEEDILVEVPGGEGEPPTEVVMTPTEAESIPETPTTATPDNPTAVPISKAHEVPVPSESTQKAQDVVAKIEAEASEEAAATGTTTEAVLTEKVAEESSSVPEPIAVEETKPENDPQGTILLAHKMLAREELPGWKQALQDSIKAWQKRVGLTADGLYGPSSAAKMAEEVGILPLVRYWPKSLTTKKEAEKMYDTKIRAVIANLAKYGDISQPHRDALTASMNREVAVTMGTDNPPAQDTAAFAEDVVDAIGVAAEEATKKELSA